MPYLGMKLGHWPKFQKLNIYSLSTPGMSKLSLFLIYGQRFLRNGPIFKIAVLGMKLGHWPNFQKLQIFSISPIIFTKLHEDTGYHSRIQYVTFLAINHPIIFKTFVAKNA